MAVDKDTGLLLRADVIVDPGTLATPVTTMQILADMYLTVLPWDPVNRNSVKHFLTGGVNPLTCSSNIYTTSQLGVCSVSGSLLGSKSVTVDTDSIVTKL